MKLMKTLTLSLLTGSALAGCATTIKISNNDAAVNAEAVTITKVGGKYTVSTPINSFSDFILVETQMGDVAPRVVDMGTVVADLAGYDAIFIGEAHGHAAAIMCSRKYSQGYMQNILT